MIGMLLLGYLLPVVLLTFYVTALVPMQERWRILAMGLFIGLSATLLLSLYVRRLELDVEEQLPEPTPLPSQEAQSSETERLKQALEISLDLQETLKKELQTHTEEKQKLSSDREELGQKLEQVEQDYTGYQERMKELLQVKEHQLAESQEQLAEQQALVDKKQKQIAALENTARDLKYELKMLIELTDRLPHSSEEEPAPILPETPPPRPALPKPPTHAQPPADTLSQLRRCIDIAQKLTGARHLGGHTPRFQDMSVDGYALDLRRLCDSLRSENFNMTFLYSQKEGRLLFVNPEVKNLLGWTPEKFVQDFSSVVGDNKVDWGAALKKLPGNTPTEISLGVKAKSGEARSLHCYLGLIPTGIFKTHVVGVVHDVD